MMSDRLAVLLIAFMLVIIAFSVVGWGFSWFCNTFLPMVPYMTWWQGWISAVVLSIIFGGSLGGVESNE